MKTKSYKNLKTLAIILIVPLLTSCEKYDKDIEGDVNIYLLEEYSTRENSSQILSAGLLLSDQPVLFYDEITLYNSEEYTFKITASAVNRIKELFGSAYAVTIDGEIIYTGYFWSSFSSAMVDWIVSDILWTEMKGELTIQLGYPWLADEWDIPDNRNDHRILSVFARDNKLRD